MVTSLCVIQQVNVFKSMLLALHASRSKCAHWQFVFKSLSPLTLGVPVWEMSQTDEIDVSDSALASHVEQYTQVCLYACTGHLA